MTIKKGVIFKNITNEEWELFKAICEIEDEDIGDVLGRFIIGYTRSKTEEQLKKNGSST